MAVTMAATLTERFLPVRRGAKRLHESSRLTCTKRCYNPSYRDEETGWEGRPHPSNTWLSSYEMLWQWPVPHSASTLSTWQSLSMPPHSSARHSLLMVSEISSAEWR